MRLVTRFVTYERHLVNIFWKTIISETIDKPSTPIEESQGTAEESEKVKVKQENIGMPNIPSSVSSNQKPRKIVW